MNTNTKTRLILLALIISFIFAYFIKPDFSITGYSVAARLNSYMVGRSFSTLGPVVLISFILAGAILLLHKLMKK